MQGPDSNSPLEGLFGPEKLFSPSVTFRDLPWPSVSFRTMFWRKVPAAAPGLWAGHAPSPAGVWPWTGVRPFPRHRLIWMSKSTNGPC